MATGKKYYWLKLSKNFFKRHDIKIIKSQKNGKDYLLFYLMLLTESVDHNGNLRFNDLIPYDVDMLSVITDTDVDVVKSAVKLLQSLKLMEILDDGTIYMTEIQRMVGSETDWAKKKRLQRGGDIVPKLSPSCPQDVRQEKDIEIEKDINIEEKYKKEEISATADSPSDNKPKQFTQKEMESMFKSFSLNDENLFKSLVEYNVMRKKLRKPMTRHAVELILKELSRISKETNVPPQAILEQSIMFSYQGVFPLNKRYVNYLKSNKPNDVEIDWLEDYIKNME